MGFIRAFGRGGVVSGSGGSPSNRWDRFTHNVEDAALLTRCHWLGSDAARCFDVFTPRAGGRIAAAQAAGDPDI